MLMAAIEKINDIPPNIKGYIRSISDWSGIIHKSLFEIECQNKIFTTLPFI